MAIRFVEVDQDVPVWPALTRCPLKLHHPRPAPELEVMHQPPHVPLAANDMLISRLGAPEVFPVNRQRQHGRELETPLIELRV